MEEGLNDRLCPLPEGNWDQYSPLELAYLGDAVFDLIVRTELVKEHRMQTRKLHRKASEIVRAGSQCRMGKALWPLLTEREQDIYRRGRNASPDHTAKNATRGEYLEATALEALFGYLYLYRQNDRIRFLMEEGMRLCGLHW